MWSLMQSSSFLAATEDTLRKAEILILEAIRKTAILGESGGPSTNNWHTTGEPKAPAIAILAHLTE